MIGTPTALKDCFVIEPKIFRDSRGYFMESYNQVEFQKIINKEIHFVQDNQSLSNRGVLRGLHYQTGLHCQSKLVRVLQGSVLDIVVDIRPESITFGQYHSEVLSDENHKQIFIPKGFAHGFLVLSKTALFSYKCDNFYNSEFEGGIYYKDPTLNIDWQLPEEDWIISEKDLNLPQLENAKKIW